MKKWPSEKELKTVQNKISKTQGSRLLGPKATAIEKAKFRLCELFVIYKNEHDLTQRELAQKLGINEALVSKILNYRFERFTIDKLLSYLSILYSEIDLTIGIA